MASGYVQVPPDSTGKKVDCTSISSGAVRQVVTVGDPTTSSGLATVTGGKLNVNASVGGTVTVAGNVSATIIGSLPNINVSSMPAVTISGTPNVSVTNNINISAMPKVVINNISATTLIAGPQATGTSGTGNWPVLVGGLDGGDSGNVHMAKVDSSGNIYVQGTVNVSSMPAISVGPISTIDKISQTVMVAITSAINLNISSMPAISVGPISTIDRISATVIVAGNVTLTGTNKIDNISATVLAAVTGSVSIVGTATITGVVTLGAGSANFGTLNNISATVLAQVTNNLNISNTPSVVLAGGTANIGTLNGISATVQAQIAGVVRVNIEGQSAGYVLYAQGGISEGVSATAGNAPMLMGGRVKTSISSTVGSKLARWAWFDKAGHQIVQMNAACLPPSATHGPKSVTLSASANTVLVASAGTACIFVDSIMVTGNLAGVSRCDVYTQNNSAAPEISAYIGTGGGGFTQKFDPPWQISAGQPLVARLKPSASAQVIASVHFHVGPN